MPHYLPAHPAEITLNDREQIQYLLGGPPSWMTQYGIGALAVFFMLLLGMAYYFKYPDVLESTVVLTTQNPPIRVPAPGSGRIDYLPVREGQLVAQGEIIAVLENPARWEDVLLLERWLPLEQAGSAALPNRLALGGLQNVYSTFSQHWQDYQYFTLHRNAVARIAAIREQIVQLEKINENLRSQNAILSEEFRFSTTDRLRQQQLHTEKVTSDQDFEKSEAAWLARKRQMAAAEASILQNEMQMQQLRQQTEELSRTESDQIHEKELMLAESREQLRSAIAGWKQSFLVTAPIAGRVSFPVSRTLHESLNAGDEMLAIVPEQPEKTIARAQVPASNLGKVHIGARAVIYIDAWPSQQYGALEGSLANISAIPKEASYLIEISLPDSLMTTYGKPIPFRQEMPGTVRIITEERRVLDRIFDSVRDLLKNR